MTITPFTRNTAAQPGYRPHNPAGSHPTGTRPTSRRTPSAPVTPVPAQYWPHWQPSQAAPPTNGAAASGTTEISDAAITVTIELNLDLASAGQHLSETLATLQAALRQIGGAQLRVGSSVVGSGVVGSGAGVVADRLANSAEVSHDIVDGDTAAAAQTRDGRALRILADERTVWWGSREIYLSRLEFDLLLFFAEHPRRAFSRRQLLESVWGYTQASRRTVDVHIRRLRAKLDGAGPLLATIRGIGYRLDTEARITIERQSRAA